MFQNLQITDKDAIYNFTLKNLNKSKKHNTRYNLDSSVTNTMNEPNTMQKTMKE